MRDDSISLAMGDVKPNLKDLCCQTHLKRPYIRLASTPHCTRIDQFAEMSTVWK